MEILRLKMSNTKLRFALTPWRVIRPAMGDREGKKPDKLVDGRGNLIATFPTHTGNDDNYNNAVLCSKAPKMLEIICEVFNQINLDDLPIKDRPALYVKILGLLRELQWRDTEDSDK